MIDWTRVDELRSEIGADGFSEVVDVFLEEVGETVARLTGAECTRDLLEAVHFLKGSSLNLGFEVLAQNCREFEQSLKLDRRTTGDVIELVQCFDRSKSEFLKRLG